MLPACQLRLWEACEMGDVDAVKHTLSVGATIHEKNRFGWTALHRACMGGSAECVQLVLPQEEKERASCVTLADAEGNQPLHIAAGCAHAQLVPLLVNHGASVSARKGTADGLNEDGATPIHTACKALAAAEEANRQERLIDTVRAEAINVRTLSAALPPK